MPNRFGNTFGRRLAVVRQQLGLSRQVVADRAGLSRETVRLIETGQVAAPRLDTLLRLQRALRLPSIELVLGGVTRAPSEDLWRLLD